MEHEEVRALIEAAADGRLDEAGMAMMREHIAACPACRLYAQNLSDLEAHLRHSLQSRYPETSETVLLSTPLEGIQARSRRDQMTRSIFRTAAWLAVAALFVFAISWAIRNTAPQQPITAGQTAVPAHTPTPSVSPNPNPTAVVATQPAISSSEESSLVFPNARFILPTQLPEAPAQVMLYAQDYPEIASPENIAQAASRFLTRGRSRKVPARAQTRFTMCQMASAS